MKYTLLSFCVALALATGACAESPAATASVPPEPVSAPVPGSSGPPVVDVDCGAPIEGLDAVLRPGQIVLMGELHGTSQIPMFVAQIACRAAQSGIPVRLGLEIPREEASAVAAFIESTGDAAAVAALVQGKHWTRPDQDGRSSTATVAVLDHVRRWRQAGLNIEPFVFDVDAPGPWNERDAAMAAEILHQHEHSAGALVLTLSGNLHNRTNVGLPWDETAVPMGVVVSKAEPDVMSLDVRYQPGTAWICAPECGLATVGGAQEDDRRAVVLFETPDEFGHHGVFTVGPIEAAEPAVAVEPSPG